MKRGKFSLSNYKLLSLDMGELTPIGMFEVLPGDTVQQATSALIRCAPMLAPVMHPVHCRIHHWYVPHRLVWEDWEDFITGGPDGMDASVFPTISMPAEGGAAVGSLADYLGIPPGVDSLEVSALPFRAYAMIFNEFYRDQDLVSELAFDVASGPDTTTSTTLQNCAWEKDYFTSARPWEQKGPAVTVPLGTEAPLIGTSPVLGAGFVLNTGTVAPVNNVKNSAGLTTNYARALSFDQATNPWFGEVLDAGGGNYYPQLRLNGGTGANPLRADLSAASAVTVNILREALALQRFEEARARYGSRYVEYLRYLGVRSSDARLQRPEYLGGGRQTIQFSEVLQTSPGSGDPDDTVGALKGHGIGAMRSNRYRRFFEEHGYVISLMSVLPKTMYTQGLARTWNRRAKEDFWQRELQHIGQQEILNKEVYAAHASPNDTFGYQDRYDEYRRQESTVAGEFRDVLNYWHFARSFGSSPALNSTFVTSVPTDVPFASPNTDVLYVMANHSVQARRLVAPRGTSFIF